MNLVNLIKDQFSNDLIGKLASLVGGNEQQTRSALGAIIPAVLAAFSRMSSGSGADKLAAAINQFDSSSASKMTDLVAEDSDRALSQGTDLLGKLFGSSTLSGLASTLSRFGGLDSGGIRKLLAYAAPMIMGTLARQFQGKAATAQGLRSLFAEQKDHIASAMPAGLSLDDVPGIAEVAAAKERVTSAARHTAAAAEQTGSSLAKTLLTLGALALLGLLAWNFFGRTGDEPADQQVASSTTEVTANRPIIESQEPAVTTPDPAANLPDVSTITQDLNTFYANATETLSGITDQATAEAAVPTLQEMRDNVQRISALQEQLPAAARTAVAKVASDNLGKLTELIEKVYAIPGVAEKLRPILDPIVDRLKALEPAAATE